MRFSLRMLVLVVLLAPPLLSVFIVSPRLLIILLAFGAFVGIITACVYWLAWCWERHYGVRVNSIQRWLAILIVLSGALAGCSLIPPFH
jgi:hypothetical protein